MAVGSDTKLLDQVKAPLLYFLALSLGCANPKARSAAPSAGGLVLDQRVAGGGFAPPRRAPRPRRLPLPAPSLRSTTRGLLLPALTPTAPAASSSPLSSLLQLGVTRIGVPPKVAPLPPRAGCGYVKVGARQIPLDCATPAYGFVQSAAEPLVQVHRLRRSEWHAGAAELPSHVDHRAEGDEGPIVAAHAG